MTAGQMAKGTRLSWFRDYLPAGQLVLDASVLLNVLGCGAIEDVLGALSGPCLVEDKVLGEIQRHPVPSLCHLTALQALIKSGYLARVTMTDAEYALYLSMVQAPLGVRLDAGESATLAIANSRGHAVVMDENKGRRYLAERFPNMEAASSLTLFISATFRFGRDRVFLRNAVLSARNTARMAVPRDQRELLLDVVRNEFPPA